MAYRYWLASLTPSESSVSDKVDTEAFEKVFPAFRKGPSEFSRTVACVPEYMREAWYRAVAYIALKERDASALKWILGACGGQLSDKFEWEAYAVKQNKDVDAAAAECWEVIVGSGFEEPHHWRLKNPKRSLADPMY